MNTVLQLFKQGRKIVKMMEETRSASGRVITRTSVVHSHIQLRNDQMDIVDVTQGINGKYTQKNKNQAHRIL
jgi:hypothetical protein